MSKRCSKARRTGDPEHAGTQHGVGNEAMGDAAAIHHGVIGTQSDEFSSQLKLRGALQDQHEFFGVAVRVRLVTRGTTGIELTQKTVKGPIGGRVKMIFASKDSESEGRPIFRSQNRGRPGRCLLKEVAHRHPQHHGDSTQGRHRGAYLRPLNLTQETFTDSRGVGHVTKRSMLSAANFTKSATYFGVLGQYQWSHGTLIHLLAHRKPPN